MKECPECGKCLDDDQLNCPRDGFPLNVSLKGTRLIDGKYLLERCLGSGAMGSVYQAKHIELQKIFALKLIRHSGLSNASYLARFRTEAKALGKLQHPNVVQVTDYGIDPRNRGIPYLVMEYLEGMTLFHHIRAKGYLAIEEALPLLESIASALDYAHSCGILHRDLKLTNIFLVEDISGRQQVKILDFGLARIKAEHPVRGKRAISQRLRQGIYYDRLQEETETLALAIDNKNDSSQVRPSSSPLSGLQKEKIDRLTQSGTVMGTPGYIAPEIFRGHEATTVSDIYSFGVVVYEVLIGCQPFRGSRAQIIYQHTYESPRFPSAEQFAVPKELDQAILEPLNNEPNMRPNKAMDVVRNLKEAYARYRYRI